MSIRPTSPMPRPLAAVELPVATVAAGLVAATAIPPVISIAATSAAKVEGQTGTTAFTFTVTRDVGEGASSVELGAGPRATRRTPISAGRPMAR